MTIKEDKVTLWDSNGNKLWLYAVPCERQYKYIEGEPCITFGIAYENASYMGCDEITIFDKYLTETIAEITKVYEEHSGEFRLYDTGADTDGYVDFKTLSRGSISISGRLGATFSSNTLTFEFVADQTLLEPLIQSLLVSQVEYG
jgi:hypothetical protein